VSKLKFVLPAILVIAIFSIVSCTKTNNNTTVVKDSIYYSNWSPLAMTMQVDPTSGDTFYVQTITAPSVTASIISKGAVLGYFGYPSSATDTTVLTESAMAASEGTLMAFSPGQIFLNSVYDLTYSASAGYLFRYVVIPADILTTSFNGMTQQQLNKMSFSDVQKAINSAKQTSGKTLTP